MSPTAFLNHKKSKNCLKLYDSGKNTEDTLNSIEENYEKGDFIYVEHDKMSAVLMFKSSFTVKNSLAFEYFYLITWQNIDKRDSWCYVTKSRKAKPEEISLIKTKFKIT